jgi:hypothetical protein
MERYTFLSVLAVTLVALALALFIPGKEAELPRSMPWQVEQTEGGSTRVFGIELGSTTLSEVEAILKEEAEVSLFARDEGKRVVEAYFDNVDFSGLRARMVLVMALEPEEVDGMFDRGVRIANMGGGSRKVTLADIDLQRVGNTPVGVLTYIPRINLDAETIEKRFGTPARRIKEKEGVIEHWLYPEKGLDIALDPEGKEVLQYVTPGRFDSLLQPLLQEQ